MLTAEIMVVQVKVGCEVVTQLDANGKVGPEVIPDDPNRKWKAFGRNTIQSKPPFGELK